LPAPELPVLAAGMLVAIFLAEVSNAKGFARH
jgi:hypothetical protein